MRTVVLVEGESDKTALETLATRLGRDLAAEEVDVIAIGGATNVGRFVRRLDAGAHVAGLLDAGERRVFERALATGDLEAKGFFTCDKDLEDELIRALGPEGVVRVIDEQGDLASFRTMQQQPFHRDQPIEHQLRRFMGTTSGRKAKYARVLVEALDLDRAPPPLDQLLERLGRRLDGRG